uniref:Cysteine synthase A n=1 Tax=Clostridioides difficile TaxID=1496 RepID=A0A381IA88_CLODI|nr:cysteine synthase A [Clostridioides difficile]
MLHLSKIADEFGVQGNIYAKMEYLNPGFSKKDRVALQMITGSRKLQVYLVPGQAVCGINKW